MMADGHWGILYGYVQKFMGYDLLYISYTAHVEFEAINKRLCLVLVLSRFKCKINYVISIKQQVIY